MAKRRKAGQDTAVAAAWRASRGGLMAIGFFTVFINLLKFATPLYLLQVLDRVQASRSVETLIMLTVAALFAVACGYALDIIRRRMLTRWGIWIERQFGPRIVQMGLSGSMRRDWDTGRALSDLGKLRSFVTHHAVAWIDVMWAPVFFLGVWLIHPLLGAVALGAVFLLVVLGVLQEWSTREPRRASSDAYREAGDLMLTAGRNKESVGALSMAPNLTERWRRSASSRLTERERIEARSTTFNSMIQALGEFLRIAMIAFGIWLVISGSLSLGGIFAARVMAGFGYRLADRAVRNWRSLREAMAAYANLKGHLAEGDAVPPTVLPGTTDAPLVFDLVSFRHPGERDDLFRRLSLELEPGQMLLITGTAASGKTTLARLMVGLLEPRYGQIRFGDVEVVRLPEGIRADLIGYLPQHTELFSGTIRENIARMGDGPVQAVVDAARLVGIHDMIVHMPQGYDTEIGADTHGMSGSERKRVAIARAIYRRPRLIVLDEPSANLDAPSRRLLEAALRELKEAGCTIVVTQAIQQSQMARIADKFLILGGRTPELTDSAAQGTKAKLRSVT
jgi:ATP-binding cassette subfamily C protein